MNHSNYGRNFTLIDKLLKESYFDNGFILFYFFLPIKMREGNRFTF